jgi:hypothetical protein
MFKAGSDAGWNMSCRSLSGAKAGLGAPICKPWSRDSCASLDRGMGGRDKPLAAKADANLGHTWVS